jgi:hypothetical protein
VDPSGTGSIVARVRRSASRAGALVVIAASAAALLSALGGAWVGLQELDDARPHYENLPASLRDDPVGLYLGYDVATWDALGRTLGRGDRYAVVARGPGRHEVRNYAAYALLPAIQVLPDEDPDVVVHYGRARGADGCVRVGEEACIVRVAGA